MPSGRPCDPSSASTRPSWPRRCAAFIVGLAASLAVAATVEAPADSPPAASDAVLGVWTHAYASFGQPKYPRGFDHFDYVDPAAPKGGALYLRNPDRRSSFDKFNAFTTKGAAPAGMYDLHARVAGDAVGGRAADDVRPRLPRKCWSPRQVGGDVPHPSPGALLQRRSGDRGRRQVQLRLDVGQAGVAQLPDGARRRRACRRRRHRERFGSTCASTRTTPCSPSA